MLLLLDRKTSVLRDSIGAEHEQTNTDHKNQSSVASSVTGHSTMYSAQVSSSDHSTVRSFKAHCKPQGIRKVFVASCFQ
jgi:hypothetical protein